MAIRINAEVCSFQPDVTAHFTVRRAITTSVVPAPTNYWRVEQSLVIEVRKTRVVLGHVLSAFAHVHCVSSWMSSARQRNQTTRISAWACCRPYLYVYWNIIVHRLFETIRSWRQWRVIKFCAWSLKDPLSRYTAACTIVHAPRTSRHRTSVCTSHINTKDDHPCSGPRDYRYPRCFEFLRAALWLWYVLIYHDPLHVLTVFNVLTRQSVIWLLATVLFNAPDQWIHYPHGGRPLCCAAC